MVCCKMRAKVHIIIIKCNYFVCKLGIFNIKTNLLKLEENR